MMGAEDCISITALLQSLILLSLGPGQNATRQIGWPPSAIRQHFGVAVNWTQPHGDFCLGYFTSDLQTSFAPHPCLEGVTRI